MAQTIRFMDKAMGVTPAADNADDTLQPAQGAYPAKTYQGAGVVVAEKASVTLAAATDPLAAGDIYVVMCLPKGHELVFARMLLGDIDTGATMTLTLAQLTKDFTDIVAGTEVIIASTGGQTGGVVSASNVPGLILAASTEDKWYGVKVVAAATGLNAGTVMAAELEYRAA